RSILAVDVEMDPDQDEGLAGQVLDERPLVGPLGPSGESLVIPEIEQDDLAPVVAQLEALAVLVLALDVRRHLADRQVTNLEQFRLRLLPNRTAGAVERDRDLHVAVFLGPDEERFDLPGDLGAVLPLQFLKVVLAEHEAIALGKVRPVLVLEHVESVQAVVQELRQRQAGERLNLLVRVLFQDATKEQLGAPVEPENDLLAAPAEPVALDVVAP